ncbi:MAG: transposase, partial [Fimbriiglobus sp.]
MLLDPILERFAKGSPLTVMARATIAHAIPDHKVNELFERTAQAQYTRELLFSTVVQLMSLV